MNKKQINLWVSSDSSIRLWDDKVTGLFLKRNAKSVSWNLAYKTDLGQKKSIKLGLYPDITLDTARLVSKTHLANIVQGEDPQKSRLEKKEASKDTIRSYLESTYAKVLNGKKSGSETMTYFTRHCDELLNLTFAELSAKHIHKWHIKMLDKGLKDSSIQRVYGAFKTLIYDAVKKEHIKDSPIQHVNLDTYHRPDQGVKRVNERRYLNQQQISDLMLALDLYQDNRRSERANSIAHGKSHLDDFDELEFVDFVKPAISFMFYTGFRPSDIRTLDWKEVRLDGPNPFVKKVIEKTKHKNNDAQEFPLVPEVANVLLAWRKQNGSPNGGLVFPNSDGGMRTKRFLADPWKKRIRPLANLPEDFDLYNLRHNFASWLVMSGADLLTVARLMGHANTKMVEKHYGHLAPEHKQNALAKAFTLMSNRNE